jgi:hypothetical protein
VLTPEPPSTPSAADTASITPPPKGTASTAGAPAPAAKSSRREIAQLVRIRALLDRDPAAAYRLITQSEREFPRGLLSEERQALGIVALARTGAADQAEQSARQFFQRYPQSPLRERIQTALKR